MKQYGVVLIGCGHIGSEHIADIYYRDNIRIVAVVDADASRAEQFKRKYNAQYADTDYLKYLKMQETDIVIIASPASTHLAILKDCVKHKKHVLCEKPLAVNCEDGQEFYDLCKGAESKVLIGHILRYNQTFIKVKELIDAGVIGNLRLVRMVQNHNIINADRYHSLMRECSPIFDCGVHYYDLLQWISGSRITDVSGFSSRVSKEFGDIEADYGMVNLFTENGVSGYYEAGWIRGIPSNNTKEFIGDKGSISVTLNQFRASHTEEGDLIEIYKNEDHSYQMINVSTEYKPMYRQLSALIDLIEDKPSEATTIDEAYSAFRVALAADEATKTKMPVKVK